MNVIVIQLGANVLAARVYAMNFFLVTTILWSVAIGMGMGMQVAIAHRVGAGRYDNANDVFHQALRLALFGNVASAESWPSCTRGRSAASPTTRACAPAAIRASRPSSAPR
jgi:hypothetical protein